MVTCSFSSCYNKFVCDNPQLEFEHVDWRRGVNVKRPEVVQADRLVRLDTGEVVPRRWHDQIARLVINGVGSHVVHQFLLLFISKVNASKRSEENSCQDKWK